MKKLVIAFLFITCNNLCFSQNSNKQALDKIDENKIVGTYLLNDTVNNLSVSIEIVKNNKFTTTKQEKDSKTVTKGSWGINNDTLTFSNINTEIIPKPTTTIVYYLNEIKLVFRNNKLCIISQDGVPMRNICIERKL